MPQHPVGHRPDDVAALFFRDRELAGVGCFGGHDADPDEALLAHLLEHRRGCRVSAGSGLDHELERRDSLGGLG